MTGCYVIMGDAGMGLTHGTLGAVIVADLSAGRPNKWAPTYDPSRKVRLGATSSASLPPAPLLPPPIPAGERVRHVRVRAVRHLNMRTKHPLRKSVMLKCSCRHLSTHQMQWLGFTHKAITGTREAAQSTAHAVGLQRFVGQAPQSRLSLALSLSECPRRRSAGSSPLRQRTSFSTPNGLRW